MARAPQQRTGDLDKDKRFARFAELFVAGVPQMFEPGNAYQAAQAAGYSKRYAQSHAYRMARLVKIKMGAALEAQEVNTVTLAARLKKKLDAQAVKWNPQKVVRERVAPVLDAKGQELKPEVPELRGGWDKFEDNGAQLRAIELAAEMLEAFPATGGSKTKVPTGDGRILIVETSITRGRRAL